MHNWWAEYDVLMANYRAMFADNVCHNPEMLNASLLIIEAKIEKVALAPMYNLIKTVTSKPNNQNICLKLGEVGMDPERRAIGLDQRHSASRGLQEHHWFGKGAQPVLGGAIRPNGHGGRTPRPRRVRGGSRQGRAQLTPLPMCLGGMG